MEDLLVSLGATPGAARSASRELAERHAEPHRHHHTLEHVTEALTEVRRLLVDEPDADPVAVELATWFHDAIYDPVADPGASEAASAELVEDRLPALDLIDRDRLAAEVARLVLLTAGHRVEGGDRSGAVLVDADLWILASPSDRYDRYAREVRAEYAHVSAAAWALGRGAVLDGFLVRLDGLDGLFTAGRLDDRAARRAAARANLSRELAALGAGAGPPP